MLKPLSPRVLGIETEYGVLVRGAGTSDPIWASQLLLEHCEQGVPCAGRAVSATEPPTDLMLANGARFYIDHAHPEYSTPEVTSAREAVAADKAGEVIVDTCRRDAENAGTLPAGAKLLLYKNNSDQKGRSYGCHENYMVHPDTYVSLVTEGSTKAVATLVPFLITRSILCGAGKVGAENGTAATGFQLTQRADFFETLLGLQTTHHRPLINTRDEAHAARQRYRRLHVIVGDANLAEISTFLKVGTAMLVIDMIESGVVLPNMTLADPLAAFREVSRDLQFHRALPLRSGERSTAIELQKVFLAHARRYVERRETPSDEQHEVLALWSETLDHIERDWTLLASRLDWAIKRTVLESYLNQQECDWDTVAAWEPVIARTCELPRPNGQDESVETLVARMRGHLGSDAFVEDHMSKHGLRWNDYWRQRAIHYRLHRLDMEYHDLRHTGSGRALFYELQARGAIERIVSDEQIQKLVDRPPETTRAHLRGHCIRRYGRQISRLDWSWIRFDSVPAPNRGSVQCEGSELGLDLVDPLAGTRQDMRDVFEPEPTSLRELLARLRSKPWA